MSWWKDGCLIVPNKAPFSTVHTVVRRVKCVTLHTCGQLGKGKGRTMLIGCDISHILAKDSVFHQYIVIRFVGFIDHELAVFDLRGYNMWQGVLQLRYDYVVDDIGGEMRHRCTSFFPLDRV